MTKWILVLLALALSGCTTPAPRVEDLPWTNPFLGPTTAIRVEIDHVPGYAPSSFALEGFRAVLDELGMRATFEVSADLVAKGSPCTVDEIRAIHERTYEANANTWRDASGTPVMHVLYLDGNATIPAGGLYVPGTPVIVVFLDTMPQRSLYLASISNAPWLPGREGFERTMLVHEYGHALGLVGCGLPEIDRRGVECHSPNPESVMNADYHVSEDAAAWALEDDAYTVWRFDADDWADIRAGQALLSA